MKSLTPWLTAAFIIIAISLFKLAFFRNAGDGIQLIPQAHAEGGILEWKGSDRLVTVSADGATTYVWDYDAKTKVRKYSLEGDALKLQIFELK